MKKRKVIAILEKYAKQLSGCKLIIWTEDNDPENKCFDISHLKLQKSAKKLDDYASIVAEFYLGSTNPMLTFRSRGKMSQIIPSPNVLPEKDVIVYQTFLRSSHNEDNEKIMFEFIGQIDEILLCEQNRLYLKT